jgi:pyruvate/2-oxoglutarate dehydrogenase complex dihydrolipoamide dehydrogenase (E3) component
VANTVLGLCEKFGCLPSQLLREDAGILRMLKIQHLGNPEQDEAGYDDA